MRRGKDHRIGRIGRTATVAAIICAVVAGGAAVSLAGGESDGRDGSTVPGPPTETPLSPAPLDGDGGRGANATPELQVAELQIAESAVLDNGRDGPDPSVGPLPVAQAQQSEITTSDVGGFDTDSGLAPAPSGLNGSSAPSEAAATDFPIDQDVSGTPRVDSPVVALDAVANDRDG